MERKQWLATRKTGIGGTDAAAILGFSPWKSQMDVWLDKRGAVPERADPDKEFLLDLGLRLEPVIAGLYERETKREIVTPSQKIFRHRQHPFLLASPDRIGAEAFGPGPKFGVELKTENQFSDQFCEPYTDEVPQHYLLQCAHYMNVMDFPEWDVAVLHGGVKFSVYRLHRDAELEQMMTERLLVWWDRHIIGNVPPDVDRSDAWRVYLHQKFPVQLLPMEKIDDERREMLTRYAQVRSAEKVIEALRDEMENQFKALIGDREGIYGAEGRITWKKTKDGKSVDYESAYRELRGAVRESLQTVGPKDAETMARVLKSFDELSDTCLSVHTQTRPGVRRFLFMEAKEFHGFPRVNTSNDEAIRALAGSSASDRGDGG
jgi:putative phage-type endonuclease